MAQSNVDCLRRMVDAYNARDFDAALSLLHPDLVWYPEADQPEAGPYRGGEAYLRYAWEWLNTFQGYQVDAREFVEVGDCVAMAGRVRGSGRSSGVAVDTEAAWVWRFHDGLAVEHRECRTMDEALMLVGEPSFAERPS